jgi:glycosyltransferase involved in cell wall biosynthesis
VRRQRRLATGRDTIMRVLIVSQHYWPETFRITTVAENLARAGAQVTVLTGQPNYPDGKIFPGFSALGMGHYHHAGVDVLRVPLIPRGSGSAQRLIANYLSFIMAGTVFAPFLLARRRIDVVFVYATSPILQAAVGIVLKSIKRAPMIVWVQDLWPESLEVTGFIRNPRALAVVRAVVRWIYRCSDHLLAQSMAAVEAVKELAGETIVTYYPNPGEVACPSTQASPFTFPTGFNVVFAGNLGTAQSLETVLAAAELVADLPDLTLILVGGGSRVAWVEAEIDRRGLANVRLTGRFDPSVMPAIFEQASALLVTLARSPIMDLTVPSKIQTYLAAGRPIVAALDGEGARVVRDSGAGLTSPAGDAPSLAANLRALYAAPLEKRAAMGAGGLTYYRRHYDPDKLTGELLELFQTTVSRARTDRVR